VTPAASATTGVSRYSQDSPRPGPPGGPGRSQSGCAASKKCSALPRPNGPMFASPGTVAGVARRERGWRLRHHRRPPPSPSMAGHGLVPRGPSGIGADFRRRADKRQPAGRRGTSHDRSGTVPVTRSGTATYVCDRKHKRAVRRLTPSAKPDPQAIARRPAPPARPYVAVRR